MPLEVIATPYGPPAMDLLAGRVAAEKASDPFAPVTVIVPSNAVAVAVRRALAARGGVIAITFLTLHRLAELIGGPVLAAAGRRPVSPPVIGAAIRDVLAHEPGLFAPVAAHPATEDALAFAHRELSEVSDPSLERLAAQSARAAEVVRVHRAIQTRLAPEWFAEPDLLAAAAEAIAVAAGGGRDPAVAGTVIVHLPERVTGGGGRLLAALAAHHPVVVHVGVGGDARADAAHRDALAAAGIVVPEVTAAPRPVATRIVSVSDPDEEVRAAVRIIVEAARSGTPLGRIAVLYGASDPYARLAQGQLDAAGIVHNGAAVHTIGDALYGRTLRGVLALPDSSFRRDDVLGLVSGAPVRNRSGAVVPARAWARISRAAGVVDGDDWTTRLDRFGREARARAAEAATDGQERLSEFLGHEAARADELAMFVAELRDDLAAGSEASSWQAMVAWVRALLDRLLGAEYRRHDWPEPERQAARRVDAALDRLEGLDALDGPRPTIEVFRRTLDAELAASLARIGRMGEGVLVGPVAAAIGVTFDLVVVLGLAEGAFPARRIEDSLLPDRERAMTGGELRPRLARTDDDHRHLLAALASATTSVLCFPRGDLRRHGDRAASRWLLADIAARTGRSVFTPDLPALRTEPWFEEIPSFTGGLARLTFPATDHEHRLATLLHGGEVRDDVLAAGRALVDARRSGSFTRYDGNLGELARRGALVDPADGTTVTSATRLEAWVACPHRYLLEHVLRVEVVADPERVVEMGALDIGSLIHEVLERFVGETIAAGGGAGRWTDDDRKRLRATAEDVCDEYEARGVTGRGVFWRRDRARILADLDRFIDHDDTRRLERSSRPVAVEHGFGLPGAAHASVALALPDGRSVLFRGSIDRVDTTGPGELVVADYKTGSRRAFQGLGPADPLLGGTKLQLPVYALSARTAFGADATPVQVGYWFITSGGDFEWIGYDLTDDVLARAGDVVALIGTGIAAGVFPARPNPVPPYGWIDCRFCDPDGLGTADRRREWERKRDDPALATYAALVEPQHGA